MTATVWAGVSEAMLSEVSEVLLSEATQSRGNSWPVRQKAQDSAQGNGRLELRQYRLILDLSGVSMAPCRLVSSHYLACQPPVFFQDSAANAAGTQKTPVSSG